MNRKYEVRSAQTVAAINSLLERGISRLAALIRHSDRHYTQTPRMEPFMGLTGAGKDYALEMGMALPPAPRPRMFASMFGRCIETAYLIDKGFTRAYNRELPHTDTQDLLAPFYIKDTEAAVRLVEQQGSNTFIRNWFDRKINGSIILDPEKTADELTDFLIGLIRDLADNEMAVCVTHDWNIFPLKEFKLGLPYDRSGEVGYLDGVIVYEDGGRYFITGYEADPAPV